MGGPRFDGGAKLTVYREDWGFSAMVQPRGLYTLADGVQTRIERGGATYPQCPDSEASCR